MGMVGVFPLALRLRDLDGALSPGTFRMITSSLPARTPGGSADRVPAVGLGPRPVARPEARPGLTGTSVGSTTPAPGAGVGEGTLLTSVDAARPLLEDFDRDGVCDTIRPWCSDGAALEAGVLGLAGVGVRRPPDPPRDWDRPGP